MNEEIRNALIRRISVSRSHRLACLSMSVDYGDGSGLSATIPAKSVKNDFADLLLALLNLTESYCLEDMSEKFIRVKVADQRIIEIGHPIKEEWVGLDYR